MHENEFLNWIASQIVADPRVPIGVGDDMAAVQLPGALALLKIDQALDRVHFDLTVHTPEQAGIKAVNRCLSDCAAMACLPAAILLAVALPPSADRDFAAALFKGCQQAAAAFNCPIVGGDTAMWDQRLALTVAAMGRAERNPVTRAGARPRDAICVTGTLGGSILGRHMTFTPRIAEAQQIVAAAPIHAMMDLSDGLATDLPRLCQRSKVGAVIESARIPIHTDAHRLADQDQAAPLGHALGDGEDYELLFTLAPQDVAKVQAACGVPIARIGHITAEPNLFLQDATGNYQPWPQGGWEYKSLR